MKYIFITIITLMLSQQAIANDLVRPDSKLTPGKIDPSATKEKICHPGYSKMARNVSNKTKEQVFREYGYDPKIINRHSFEIDHLISIELGGSNDIDNLWPQSYVTQPLNAHKKDVLENTLKRLVCENKIPLAEAQHEISTDWVVAYQKYVLHTK